MFALFDALPVDPAVGAAVFSLLASFVISVFGLARAFKKPGSRHVR